MIIKIKSKVFLSKQAFIILYLFLQQNLKISRILQIDYEFKKGNNVIIFNIYKII